MADDTFDESNTGPLKQEGYFLALIAAPPDHKAREYRSDWRRQGARWGAYAKQRPPKLPVDYARCAREMDRLRVSMEQIIPVVADVGQILDFFTASFNRPPVPWYLRPWAWVTDTYYRWRNS